MDTTRRDHVDRYATDGVTRTPFLAAKLAESVVLDNFIQCSNWTFASMHCSMTGQALEEGSFFPRTGPDGAPVPVGQPTLAHRLGEHGFRSVLSTSNNYFSALYANTQGYDVELLEFNLSTTGVTERGLAALEPIAKDDPARWFLHLHLYEPHRDYLPPTEYLGDLSGLPQLQWDMSTALGQTLAVSAHNGSTESEQQDIEAWLEIGYSGELRWMDTQLADTWSLLESGGWLDDTLVVFLTDHGEAFWEHGIQNHGSFLAREENDAVLAFWAHDLAPLAWEEPTHAIDMVPTVLHALGLPEPADVSGIPAGLAPMDRPLFTATSAYQGAFQAVTLDGWRLMYGWTGLTVLWNLEEDPHELDDRSEAEPDKLAELWSLLAPRTARMQDLIPEQQAVPPSR